MMKRENRCQTRFSTAARVQPSISTHCVQVRRWIRPNRGNSHQGSTGVRQRPDERCCAKMTKYSTLVIQRQEMTAFFRLFDDQLIRDFLWMDSCCKMTDKYLLAMAFVYFKRAHFTLREYTRRNFFISLYLANTMVEEDEEPKYEIFPWALGEYWMEKYRSFLKKRDKLWARIDYRAAVSRRCCEEVIAIAPSHFLWQRERPEHHSGAQRKYNPQPVIYLRGPFASPVHCALCNQNSSSDQGRASCYLPSSTSAESLDPPLPHLLTPTLALKETPFRAAQHIPSNYAKDVPRDGSSFGSTNDTAMDWISPLLST